MPKYEVVEVIRDGTGWVEHPYAGTDLGTILELESGDVSENSILLVEPIGTEGTHFQFHAASAGGGMGFILGEVIEQPLYEINGVPGKNYYTIRISTDNTSSFDPLAEYVMNSIIVLKDYMQGTNLITGDNLKYVCIDPLATAEDPCVGKDPRDYPEQWSQSEEIRVSKIWGAKNLGQLIIDAVPWVEVGEEVFLYQEGEEYFIIAPSLLYGGDEEQSSLRYNPSLRITQAVFI